MWTSSLKNYPNILKEESKSTPRLGKQIKVHAPWIDEEYLSMVKRKDILYSQLKAFPENTFVMEQYKRCRNLVTSMKRTKKDNYFSSKIMEDSTLKNMWRMVNSAMHNRYNIKRE